MIVRRPALVDIYRKVDLSSVVLGVEELLEKEWNRTLREIQNRALAAGAASMDKRSDKVVYLEPYASEIALSRVHHTRAKNQLRERLVAIEAEFQIEMDKIEKEFSSRIKKRYAELLKGK